MKIYLAEFETSHHSFQAVATTREDAERAVINGWKEHCDRVPGARLTDLVNPNYEGIIVTPMETMTCYRDRQPIKE